MPQEVEILGHFFLLPIDLLDKNNYLCKKNYDIHYYCFYNGCTDGAYVSS
jgi:hypothetical protein